MVNVTKHFSDPCGVPACLCVGASVMMMFRDASLLTNEVTPKPFIMGTVNQVTDLGTNGVDVRVSLDDSILPVVGGEAITPSFDDDGTLCAPLCYGECDWIANVMKLVMWDGRPAKVNRHYTVFQHDEEITDAEFLLPRIPYDSLKLLKVRASCFTYDPGTTVHLELRVGATVIATYDGPLSSMVDLEIAEDTLAKDDLPKLFISDVSYELYEDAAKGFVIELIGIA